MQFLSRDQVLAYAKTLLQVCSPRDFSIPNSPVRGPLGRAPQPARNNVPPTRRSGPEPQTVPPRNLGNGPPPGAGVGPMSTDVGKKDEGGDLAQALSLL